MNAPFLLHIRSAPAESERRELLELVLAAVALEIPVAVLFSGAGNGWLDAPFAATWRQLTDYQLAPVYCIQMERLGRTKAHELPVKILDAADARKLAGRARAVLEL